MSPAQVPELAVEIDPVLSRLNVLLDDDELYHQVRADFGQRYHSTLVHGRHSTPVEVLLRLLILKHLYQWSYKELERRVKDSLVLRWFSDHDSPPHRQRLAGRQRARALPFRAARQRAGEGSALPR